VQLSSATYLDPYGNQTGVIVILRDISELKRTQYALAESEENFQPSSGIALWDFDNRPTWQLPISQSEVYRDVWVYLKDIPDGKPGLTCIYRFGERKRAVSVWKTEHQMWIPGETKPYTRKVTCKNGDHKIICFRPVIMPNGYYYVSYEDITERETAKKRLLKAHKELKFNHENFKKIERLKEKTVDHLSHELKTPIAIIDAVFRLLLKSSEHRSPIEITRLIERGQRYLQRLINIQDQMDDIAFYSKDSEQKDLLIYWKICNI